METNQSNLVTVDKTHRPRYHFLPPANWLNDPNGMIWWKGQYHMFYQYNPNGAFWGDIHWGHAVSTDLVHWEPLGVALAPTAGTVDRDGCWSGCAVNNQGVPTLIYTGVTNRVQKPCLATATDDTLHTWRKYPGNPVIAAPPAELDVTGFRDHCVWQEADGNWYQVIGSGTAQGGGLILLYTSPDLINWQYLHPLYANPVSTFSEVWECPDFFKLGNSHTLLISSTATKQVTYYTGEFANHQFQPHRVSKLLDHGGYFYAPQSIADPTGRRLVWGWMREARSMTMQRESGWSGAMSLPLVLTNQGDNQLGIEFPAELQLLRGEHYRQANLVLEADSDILLNGVEGDCLEIIAEFEMLADETADFGIAVRSSPYHEEETVISFNQLRQEITFDYSKSSLNPEVSCDKRHAEHRLALGEPLRLHLYLDNSVLEMSFNGRIYFSGRIYPSRPDSLGLRLLCKAGTVNLKLLDIWQMASIW